MKRKYAIVLLCIIMAISLILVACKPQEHTYSDEWSYDENYHWHAAICEHPDEKTDYQEHDMQNGKCTVCGYTVGGGDDGNGGEANGFKWNAYVESGGSFGDSSASGLPEVPAGKADKPSIQIHYRRYNASEYSKWTLWLWTKSGSVGSSEPGWKFNYRDDYGVVALYPLDQMGNGTEALGFIVRQANWAAKDIEADRFWTISASEMDENNYYHLYLTQGDPGLYNSPDDIQYGITAAFQSVNSVQITTKSAIKHIGIYQGSTLLAETDTTSTASIRYTMPEGKDIDFINGYSVKVTFVSGDTEKTADVSMIALYGLDAFNDAFYYDGELGALYTQDYTEFKVWSPVSTKIVLNLYESGNGGSAYKTYDMVKGDKGVWSVKVDGDLAAKYYTYTVTNSANPVGTEIVDPYAKSAGLNGKRGQIVNFAETNPEGWDEVAPIKYDRNELVVWETHVADVTSSATWGGKAEWSKKFLGMIQEGTTYTDTQKNITVKTGFDHIKELGVNAVQLVPIFDQDNNEAAPAFNWGYNPLNYNVLEGSYSTDANDGYVRIREFKQLVQAFNGAGINIIMDVVYNHVSAAVGSNFDVLMPGYYYRYTASGDMANGSGCGNETASDHNMFRKFMIDSVKFWASEYKLGGFRFDLMGLHDVTTMNQLAAELKKINPAIVVYGEPWTGGTSPLSSSQQAVQKNANSFAGVGQFNDQMRDALIKGGLSGASDLGWVTGGRTNDADKIVSGLKGITDSGSYKINDLYKTVNYVTCHDNYTLYDRIIATGEYTLPRDTQKVLQMVVLADSVVMTSNGTSFMLAGDEFLRSKKELGATGDQVHNSYDAPYKVNELDYSRKVKFIDAFHSFQKLIEFKKSFAKELGLTSNEAVNSKYIVEKLSGGAAFKVTITTDSYVYTIVHANSSVSGVTLDLAGYELIYSSLPVELSANTAVAAYQSIIARKAK